MWEDGDWSQQIVEFMIDNDLTPGKFEFFDFEIGLLIPPRLRQFLAVVPQVLQ